MRDDRTAQLRKGVLELAVLAILGAGEAYGGELVERLARYPGLDAGAGTVYPLLGRLDRTGVVDTRWVESPAGPPRKYYRLSATGATALHRGVAAWAEVSAAMSALLNPDAR